KTRHRRWNLISSATRSEVTDEKISNCVATLIDCGLWAAEEPAAAKDANPGSSRLGHADSGRIQPAGGARGTQAQAVGSCTASIHSGACLLQVADRTRLARWLSGHRWGCVAKGSDKSAPHDRAHNS